MINLSSLFAITLCLYPYANMNFIISDVILQG